MEVATQDWETHFASTNGQGAAESLPSAVYAAANAVIDARVCFMQGKGSPHADCACRGNVDFEDATRL